MRLGLISDTHIPEAMPELWPHVYELFDGCDSILHAGDIYDLAVIDRLSEVAPTFAARGNAPDPARCADADQIGDMKQSLRGQEFTGALADIVATWEPCPAGEGEADLLNEVSLPSAARMEHVVVDEIVVGSPDLDSDSESGIAGRHN